jgi:hypothetical protein
LDRLNFGASIEIHGKTESSGSQANRSGPGIGL